MKIFKYIDEVKLSVPGISLTLKPSRSSGLQLLDEIKEVQIENNSIPFYFTVKNVGAEIESYFYVKIGNLFMKEINNADDKFYFAKEYEGSSYSKFKSSELIKLMAGETKNFRFDVGLIDHYYLRGQNNSSSRPQGKETHCITVSMNLNDGSEVEAIVQRTVTNP